MRRLNLQEPGAEAGQKRGHAAALAVHQGSQKKRIDAGLVGDLQDLVGDLAEQARARHALAHARERLAEASPSTGAGGDSGSAGQRLGSFSSCTPGRSSPSSVRRLRAGHGGLSFAATASTATERINTETMNVARTKGLVCLTF